jgi:hypothetical protein
MSVKVGDKYPWNNKGAILQVVEVKGRKVKFEVFGAVPLYGSMRLQDFTEKYLSRKVRKAA